MTADGGFPVQTVTVADLHEGLDVMLPVQLKFGAERGRLVFVAVLGICTIVAYGGMKLLKYMGIDQQELTEKIVAAVKEFKSR